MSRSPTITERFPPVPLEELVARISEFESSSTAAQADTIRTLVNAHPITGVEWGPGWRYRRARVLKPSQMVHYVGDLIWREDVAAKIGRANAAGFGVLYLGDRRDTALSEARVIDDDVVISEFVIRPGRTMRVAPIGEMIQVQRTGRGFLAGDASAVITAMMNACAPVHGRAMLITDAFLLNILTREKDDYRLSSMVTMEIYKKLPGLDAIAFPSRRQYGALNFAVRAERVWDTWGLFSIQRAHARHLAEGFYEVSEGRDVIGITHAGQLVWSNVVAPMPNGVEQLDPPWFQQAVHAKRENNRHFGTGPEPRPSS